ncbi:Uncharacterized conserved protein YfdQ, DUF2303 family [Pseudomonas peli]|uniref:Uncharacterized conserved protein YfdQ, DUF2303 family n=1 Tax=Pseudomonas peli TaxID=592361 RepID=A0AB37Z479_9PSED|nr:DUF2303 family protein [Pseudomonas peli]NMZ68843.1 YfdQ family protein [Pseudomonas peli]SCW39119.1 Uncharacterized conserved protein YfdQ, DUF2303 family [Pseudomonas peli]
MLNKETLQHIEAQALAAAAKPISIDGGSNVVVLPNSVNLHSLEQYQPARDRFRGGLKTQSLRDFSKYVERHIRAGLEIESAGFIDQDAMSATVIFNLGNPDWPGHGDDRATLTLKPSAAYTAVQAIAGKALGQQALAEWLEDWAPHIIATASDETLTIAAAISGIRKMTIKATSQRDSSVGDFSASRSAMDDIEAKSQETLPQAFMFQVVPFEGLGESTINLRLSVITGEANPVLKLRWVGEEAQREAFAIEFKHVLEREVGGFVPLTIGTFAIGN